MEWVRMSSSRMMKAFPGGHHNLFISRNVFPLLFLAFMSSIIPQSHAAATTFATDDHSALPYCTVNYDVKCDPKQYTATSYATFQVTNAISNKYKVSVTFLWDEEVNDPIHGNQMKTLTSAVFEGNFYHPRI